MSQNVELDVDDTDTCQASSNYRTADYLSLGPVISAIVELANKNGIYS